jgi:hypothetical protein
MHGAASEGLSTTAKAPKANAAVGAAPLGRERQPVESLAVAEGGDSGSGAKAWATLALDSVPPPPPSRTRAVAADPKRGVVTAVAAPRAPLAKAKSGGPGARGGLTALPRWEPEEEDNGSARDRFLSARRHSAGPAGVDKPRYDQWDSILDGGKSKKVQRA